MAGEIPYVSEEQIRSAAEKLRTAAVKVKGERELRYIPRDPGHPDRGIAGRSAKDYPARDYDIDANGNYLGTEAQWAELDSQYSWIPDFYVRAVGPEPHSMEPLINSLRSVSGKLFFSPTASSGSTPAARIEPVRSLLAPTQTALDEWVGKAAVEFRNNFMLKVPDAAQAQAYLAAALASAVQGNRDMFLALRADLLDNAKNAEIAVEQSHMCDPESVKTVMTVVGAVAAVAAGVASIPVTGGAVLAPASVAAFSIIAGISSGVDDSTLGKKKETPLGADTVDGVLAKAVDAVNDLAVQVSNKEQEMIGALNQTYGVITGKGTRDLYLVPRPGTIDMSNSELKADTDYAGL